MQRLQASAAFLESLISELGSKYFSGGVSNVFSHVTELRCDAKAPRVSLNVANVTGRDHMTICMIILLDGATTAVIVCTAS